VLLREPQPLSEETKAALRHWGGHEEPWGDSPLERILTGSRQWDVVWYGEMMRLASACETKLIGVALSLYQPTNGDPSPFPSYTQLLEDTGLPEVCMWWAIPDLIVSGLLVVSLPLAPEPRVVRTQQTGARQKAPIPQELRWAVWERDDFTCRHCGSRRKLTIDHIVPESRSGLTVIENLQTLCGPCNSAKGTRMDHVTPVTAA
jgi:HNH endonuclease